MVDEEALNQIYFRIPFGIPLPTAILPLLHTQSYRPPPPMGCDIPDQAAHGLVLGCLLTEDAGFI
jgi:hypothetical protein